MFVQDFLKNSAARLPGKTALICGSERFTYAQIDLMANRLANAMILHGVARGDRVAIYLQNSIEVVVGIFAALKAGAAFVVVNSSTKEDKLLFILNDCRATAFLAPVQSLQQGVLSRLLEGAGSLKLTVLCGEGKPAMELPARCRTYVDLVSTCSAEPRSAPCIDLDLACLIYTSGTTGEPKGVMSDHSNVVFASGSVIEYLQNVESDVVLCILPLSFDYGLYQLLMVFRFGGTLVLEKGFAFPAAILKRIEQERVTGFPGVPTVFALLLQMDLDGFDLRSLRYITNTAAALPPSHILELRKKFPDAVIYSMYGLTETKRTLYLPPAWLEKKPGSVGVAIPGTEVWIEDSDGNRLGPGQVGELMIRGRHVMRGYWERPEATAARYREGTIPGERICRSGDLFRMDEDGFMYFVARKDDIVKTRGEKVAPKEVENVLYSLSGVLEAAVVGVDDAVLGQALKAVVVVNDPGITRDRILAHCRARLEDFMVPKHVEFRNSLPKTTSGKIKKSDLA